MLNPIDEFTQPGAWPSGSAESSTRRTSSCVLAEPFILRGVPSHVRSDTGPEFIATAVRNWIAAVGARTALIEPGSPWENGFCESLNSKLRDELLNGKIFCSLAEAKVVVESWRRHHTTRRPHSSLECRPPAPEVVQWPAAPPGAASPATPVVVAKPAMHQDRNRTTRSGQTTSPVHIMLHTVMY